MRRTQTSQMPVRERVVDSVVQVMQIVLFKHVGFYRELRKLLRKVFSLLISDLGSGRQAGHPRRDFREELGELVESENVVVVGVVLFEDIAVKFRQARNPPAPLESATDDAPDFLDVHLGRRELPPDFLDHDLEFGKVNAAVLVRVAFVKELEEMIDKVGFDGRSIANSVYGAERGPLDPKTTRKKRGDISARHARVTEACDALRVHFKRMLVILVRQVRSNDLGERVHRDAG